MTVRHIGIWQILASGFCFGFLGLFGKSAYSHGITPGELLSLRFLIAGVLLLTFLVIRDPSRLLVPARGLAACLVLGSAGYALFSFCYFSALTGLSASLTVLLLYLFPVLVAAGAWIFFAEKIEPNRWVALPLAITGLLILVWGDLQVHQPISLILGLASALFYAAYILCSSHWLKNVNPLVSATYIQLSAGVTLALIHWRDLQHIALVVRDVWPLLIAMAVVCTIAAMSLFFMAQKKLANWEVSVLSIAEPVTAIALAYLFLGETLGRAQILGACAVLGAFLIIASPQRVN